MNERTLPRVMETWAKVPRNNFSQLDRRKERLDKTHPLLGQAASILTETRKARSYIAKANAILQGLPEESAMVGDNAEKWGRDIDDGLIEVFERQGVTKGIVWEYSNIVDTQTKMSEIWLATESIYCKSGQKIAETRSRQEKLEHLKDNAVRLAQLLIENLGQPTSSVTLAAELFSVDMENCTQKERSRNLHRVARILYDYRELNRPATKELYKILNMMGIEIEQAVVRRGKANELFLRAVPSDMPEMRWTSLPHPDVLKDDSSDLAEESSETGKEVGNVRLTNNWVRLAEILRLESGRPVALGVIATRLFAFDMEDTTPEAMKSHMNKTAIIMSVYRHQTRPAARRLYETLNMMGARIEELKSTEGLLLRMVSSDTDSEAVEVKDKLGAQWTPLPFSSD